MTLRHFTIRGRLAGGFAIILVFGCLLGVGTLHGLERMAQLTFDLYDHPFTVSTEVLQAKIGVAAIHSEMANLVAATDAARLEDAARRVAGLDVEVQGHLGTARERYLGKAGDLQTVEKAMAAWRPVRDEIIGLKRQGRQAEAEALLRRECTPLEAAVEKQLDDILAIVSTTAQQFHRRAVVQRNETFRYTGLSVVLVLLLSTAVAVAITKSILRQLRAMRDAMVTLADGKLDFEIPEQDGGGLIGSMAASIQVFKKALVRLQGDAWIKSNIAELSTAMQNADTPRDLAQSVITKLVPLVEGGAGVFHVWRPEAKRFELLASYGFRERKHIGTSYNLGEGLVGQCALEKQPILLTEVPDDYIRVTSGLGEAPPRTILVAPLLSKDVVVGVVEVASFTRLGKIKQALVDQLLPVVALNLEVLDRARRTRMLLEESQQQAEELHASEEKLRAQSDALQAANEELRQKSEVLQSQAEELRASEEELRAQREELQATNEELLEKSVALEERQAALEAAREKSEKHALELSVASRYKSEFLANMSHELRTPLNSLLILAKSLADNEEENLTEDQVDSARIIHDSGSHLLRLINDILDLSKVEAGKMEVLAEDIVIRDFAQNVQRRFARLAETRNLFLKVEVDERLPLAMRSDAGKIDQIINNLVANAIKFTKQGGVALRLSRLDKAPEGVKPSAPCNGVLSISVQDTGVGVPADKQERIFHAFEQADGTTSRQFGGTGLGLSISLRLAHLLDGNITIKSAEGKGSTFTLLIPLYPPAETPDGPVLPVVSEVRDEPPPPAVPAFADDRSSLSSGDDSILIIEDDDAFARILCDLSRKRGFKALRAADGRGGLELAATYRPTGILLDIALPELDGWAVMASLKQMPETRHIPVHFISAIDETVRGLQMGAAGYLKKPVSKEQMDGVFDRLRHFSGTNLRRVLIVDDDPGSRKATSVLVQADKVEIVEAGMAARALELLQREHFDCVVLDLMLPDVSGFELLDRAAALQIRLPPVVVYSGKELSYEENLKLREYTDSIVIKGARSPERLVDEVSLFLHSVQSARPADVQRQARPSQEKEVGLAGRVVLVVDDDMRNAFALSKILRAKGLKVVMAQDGQKALAQLKDNPRVELVLMDIMMPGMDGYATIKEIRKQRRCKNLPIIALTAKAMPGDKEKCLEAGANDYLSKPVDMEMLLARLRTMLCSEDEPA